MRQISASMIICDVTTIWQLIHWWITLKENADISVMVNRISSGLGNDNRDGWHETSQNLNYPLVAGCSIGRKLNFSLFGFNQLFNAVKTLVIRQPSVWAGPWYCGSASYLLMYRLQITSFAQDEKIFIAEIFWPHFCTMGGSKDLLTISIWLSSNSDLKTFWALGTCDKH